MMTSSSGEQTSTVSVVCPACGACNKEGREFEFDSGRGPTTWQRCRRCRTYFLSGDYDPDAEASHTRQMAWGNEAEGVALNQRKRGGFIAALDEIESLGYGGSRILDVGCSFGGILIEARQRGFDCAGVDIVPEAVEWMKAQGFRAQQCASLNQCSLYSPESPADVITVLDAHIYWPDQPGELRAAWRLLRDDGLLLIRAVTKSSYITTGRVVGPFARPLAKRLIRKAIADHRFSMPLKSLLKTVEDSGFEILHASPRRARHTDGMALPARAAFAVGTVLWHALGVSVAPTTLVFARKKA